MGQYWYVDMSISVKPECVSKIDEMVETLKEVLEYDENGLGDIWIKKWKGHEDEILDVYKRYNEAGLKVDYPFKIGAFGMFYIHSSMKRRWGEFLWKWDNCIIQNKSYVEYMDEDHLSKCSTHLSGKTL